MRTPLGFAVRCGREYWRIIASVKHQAMDGREEAVQLALAEPQEVRRSRKDRNVFLFYRGGPPRWICAVAKRENDQGFLVTAYPTDAIKIGDVVWKK